MNVYAEQVPACAETGAPGVETGPDCTGTGAPRIESEACAETTAPGTETEPWCPDTGTGPEAESTRAEAESVRGMSSAEGQWGQTEIRVPVEPVRS